MWENWIATALALTGLVATFIRLGVEAGRREQEVQALRADLHRLWSGLTEIKTSHAEFRVRVAESYVTNERLNRLEATIADTLVRLEQKIDRLALRQAAE
ncbi:MAG: hypothetical protein KIT20_06670 [Alphaproteobacteria bacterium]|nr:hypothetical protein [Alphaproteobacteria bacterium]